MLSLLLLSSFAVGGVSYTVDTSASRSKPVSSAPEGYKPTWSERIRIIVSDSPADRAFNTFMRDAAKTLLAETYSGNDGSDGGSFATTTDAGAVDVGEDVLAASSDVVSVHVGAGTYEAGMPHPQPAGDHHVIWSRRLNRPLRQSEVLATPPDRALRRLALARYDNREGIDVAGFPDGLPLDWDRASVGPAGITWSFGPYDLGAYVSGGSATIPWTALKPYLAAHLPFAIATLRTAPAAG